MALNETNFVNSLNLTEDQLGMLRLEAVRLAGRLVGFRPESDSVAEAPVADGYLNDAVYRLARFNSTINEIRDELSRIAAALPPELASGNSVQDGAKGYATAAATTARY